MRDPVNFSPRRAAAGTRRPSRTGVVCEIAQQVFMKAESGSLPAGIVAG
jgi:hypothetical protein